jgi:hypothetical protein
VSRWNTTWPWFAAVLFALIVAVWLGTDRRVFRDSFPAFSARSTAPEGLSLSFRYLATRAGERNPPISVRMLSKPIGMSVLERDAVVLRIAPENTRSPLHGKAVNTNPDEEKPAGDPEKVEAEPGPVRPERDVPGKRQAKRGQDPDGDAKPKGGKPARVRQSSPDGGMSQDPAGGGLLTAAEQEWIQGGGRMVLAVLREAGPLGIDPASGDAVEKVFPGWPVVDRLDPPAMRVLAGWPLRWTHTLYAVGGAPLVARQRLGGGELFLLSCPEIFQNAHVGKAGHLSMLESLAGEGRPVYFDETVHGIGAETGVLALLTSWGLGPLLVLSALAAGAAFWRRRVRLGVPVDDHRETRREAVDYVESVAQLYQRALSRHQALVLYVRHFAHAVSLKTGLRGEPLQAKIDSLAPGMRIRPPASGRDIGLSEFRRQLDRINRAFRRLDDGKRA